MPHQVTIYHQTPADPIPAWRLFRGYQRTVVLAATSQIGNGPVFALRYGLRFVRVLVLLSLWRVLFEGRDSVSGMTLSDALAYTLIAEVFAEQLSVKTRLLDHIWDGRIAVKLLAPPSLVGQVTAETVGSWLPGLLLVSLPLLVLSPLLSGVPLPSTVPSAAWFALSLGLSVTVGIALDFIFGAVVALGSSVWLVEQLRAAFVLVLSGAAVPLALLPTTIGEVLSWSPFASTASAPLRIYTDTGEPLPLLLLQLGWSVVLWTTAWAMWRRYRGRLANYGG